MKKFLRLLLLAALMVPLGARATTDTLTVADGSATSSNLPIYGLWADADQHNQMIYPASMLTEMIGQNIIGLNFTISGGFSCNAVVSMAIVPDSTLSGIITDVTLVQVWSGDATGQMMLEFTNAFAYSGGNLLIDIQTEAGSYSSSSCTGISRTGAAYYSYNGSQNPAGFLPQATFIYSDAAFCNAPMALTFDGNTTFARCDVTIAPAVIADDASSIMGCRRYGSCRGTVYNVGCVCLTNDTATILK